MPYHKHGAYDGFDRLEEARTHYKRCRTVKFFILSDKGVEADKPICPCCGEPINLKDGNRAEYFPRNQKIAVMHYICSWEQVVNQLYKFADALC